MNVAIVIPTHNRAEMVCQAIESALAQELPCRVVVVDDGSTDDTPKRVGRFGTRISYVRQENKERGAARNRGVMVAKEADLICFLDADDLLTPHHVRELAQLSKLHPDAAFLASSALVILEDGTPSHVVRGTSPGRISIDRFLAGTQPVSPTMLAVRRDRFLELGGFPESRGIAGSEDWLLVCRLLLRGHAIRGSSPTAKLRLHPGNTAGDPERMHRSMLAAHATLFGFDEAAAIGRLERASKADLLVRSAIGFYAAGDMRRTRQLLAEAVAVSPGALLNPLVAWTATRSLLGGRLSHALRSWKHGRRREKTPEIL